MHEYDAIVVGSGPNGLSAAVELARAGLSVLVREANPEIGGGCRSAELTLPGFVHDLCSAIHPMAIASPFFQSLPLAEHGLEWIHPPSLLAHPLDGEPPAMLEQPLESTAMGLEPDAGAYRRLLKPLVQNWRRLVPELLGPLLHVPSMPLALAGFGARGLWPASVLAETIFHCTHAQALFAGVAAHSILPLEKPGTSAFGLMLLGAGHTGGWPLPRGGAQKIPAALASCLSSFGGEIETGAPVSTLDDLPSARAVLLDCTPRQVARIAAKVLTGPYLRSLERFRYGPGVFKIDWALSEPIPWKDPECARAGTVHLGGTAAGIEASEAAVARGSHPEKPFVLLSQPSLFDPTRVPSGRHTAWAYCHVPHGSLWDMTEIIEAQVERFAPGFRDLVLARSTRNSAQLERGNANLVGGDITGGANDLAQIVARPVLSLDPYRTPAKGLYICSASTPPGGGVHGMCGYHAARSALKHTFGR